MDIFVGNLAERTKAGNLALILAPFSDTFRFTLYEHATDEGETEYYGHVSSLSEEEGQRAIRVLNGIALHGQKLVVREYFHRNAANDRRLKQTAEQAWQYSERRRSERRQGDQYPLGMYAMDDDPQLSLQAV